MLPYIGLSGDLPPCLGVGHSAESAVRWLSGTKRRCQLVRTAIHSLREMCDSDTRARLTDYGSAINGAPAFGGNKSSLCFYSSSPGSSILSRTVVFGLACQRPIYHLRKPR